MAKNKFFSFMSSKNESKIQEVKTDGIKIIYVQEETAGTSGTEVFAGVFNEEYIDSLQSIDRAVEYNKIRRDYQLAGLLKAVKGPILGASREVVAASESPEHERHKALCKKVLFEDICLDSLLSDQLRMCDFGYSILEESHRPIMEPVYEDEKIIINSYITMNQPEWRHPKTIYNWNFDPETKKLKSVTQVAQGDLGGYNEMDARFLNILTLDKEGQNLEGTSLLRPCYGPYLRKNNYLKLNAIGIEKSQPIPTAEIPSGKENTAEFKNLKTALSRFTSHQQNYLTYPAGWNVQLSNGTAYDPSKAEVSIDNEDKRMAMAFLANFLMLGSTGRSGSYALSNDLSDFFLSGEVQLAKLIEKSINLYIEKIVMLNFGKQDKYPKFKLTGINDKIGIEFAEMLKALVDSKVIVPDVELEENVRNRLSLPRISEEGQREINPAKPEPAEPKTLSEKIMKAIRMRS